MKKNRNEALLLVLLVSINLVIGALTVADYGESWDEAGFLNYAGRSLRAYEALINPSKIMPKFQHPDPIFGDHGPAFVMLVVLITRTISNVNNLFPSVEIHHFIYFLMFQIGTIFFYLLSRRWLSFPASLGATALFSTQPILWGHAFINPKDAPFMSLFLVSIVTGLSMVDRGKENKKPITFDFKFPFKTQINRRIWLTVAVVWLVIMIVVFMWGEYFIIKLITQAYMEGSSSFLGRIFERIATYRESIPLDLYVNKGVTIVRWIKAIYAIVSTLFVLAISFVIAPDLVSRFFSRLISYLRIQIHAFASFDVWLASIVLGFASAVRFVAPFAGFIVALYVLIRRKWNAFPRLIAYAFLSIVAMVFFWPYLWPAPVERLASTIMSNTNYPIDVQTLFGGEVYYSNNLPLSYLPVLVGTQLTETTLILVLCGLIISLLRKIPLDLGLVLTVWFLVPFAFLVLNRVPVYDNARHILFILPPLFIMAGYSLDWLFSKLPFLYQRVFLCGILLFPAIFADIYLHPYQYIYYNQLVGGVTGAYREYQLDYWCISYREAALYLNQVASENAKVISVGPVHLMRAYIRPDIQLVDSPSSIDNWSDLDYIVVSTRNNQDEEFSQFRTVYSVSRAGAILTVVKRP